MKGSASMALLVLVTAWPHAAMAQVPSEVRLRGYVTDHGDPPQPARKVCRHAPPPNDRQNVKLAKTIAREYHNLPRARSYAPDFMRLLRCLYLQALIQVSSSFSRACATSGSSPMMLCCSPGSCTRS